MSSIVPLPRASGIYQITCTPTGKIYIGSSQNILLRSWRHRTALNAGKHESAHLQRAWEKYGRGAFVFTILELCEIEKLLEREQHFLDTLKPYDHAIGFNCGMYAGAATRGRKHTPETRQKLSSRAQARTAEQIQRNADARRGGKRSTETRQKISEASKRQSAESRKQIADAKRGRKDGAEARKNKSRAAKLRCTTPEARQKMAAAARKRWHG